MRDLFNWTLVFVAPLFVCALIQRGRVRQSWAKSSFVIVAVIGPLVGLCGLALDLGWFEVSEVAGRGVRSTLSCGRGLMLGLILALVMSGELRGRLPTEKTA